MERHIHGLAYKDGKATRLYQIWLHMRVRCLSKKSKDYKHYGARGISICSEWDDFKVFYEWAYSANYNDHLTLERVDNNRGYGPDNCMWATRKEQARNKRNNRLITFDGQTQTVAEWADTLNISYNMVRMRLHRGWTEERALNNFNKIILQEAK